MSPNPVPTAPVPPRLPTSAQVVYDELMATIEPDLMTASMPRLSEKYKNESSADREARARRYEQAFVRFDDAFKAYVSKIQASVKDYRKSALAHAEARTRLQEDDELAKIESQIAA